MKTKKTETDDLCLLRDHTVSLPKAWLNLAAQIPTRMPLPVDENGETISRDVLEHLHPAECARIELLEGEYGREPFIPIPEPVLDEYRKYRPTPLRRARGLERVLNYPGAIYFKREDNNPTGSHKPNTAIPQAYYAATQGLRHIVTDTGAGQWGAALAWAARSRGLACTVFMTRNSYLSKPYRRHLMEFCGAKVVASPSDLTVEGRRLLETDPSHRGSLGIGMGEALEFARLEADARVCLGCMSYYAALHQTVIGQELVEQLALDGVKPDVLLGCVGGGTNFIGFIAPYVPSRFSGGSSPRLVAVESANIPVLTKGRYTYEHADAFGYTPRVKMYTLGREWLPPEIHAGGLRYHGKSPILSLLVNRGLVEAVAIAQEEAFEAGRMFFEVEGVLPAPESSHAIAQVVREARSARDKGESPTLVFCLSGHGYLDLQNYAHFFGLDT